jgi:hypothetical protein
MMKRLAYAFAVISLALTGCGGSVCEDVADSFNSFIEKAKPCLEGVTIDPISDADIEMCEENIDNTCSDADKEALQKFTDCLNDLDTCSSSNQNAWAAEAEKCTTELEKVSDGCGAVTAEGVEREMAVCRAAL